MIRIFLSALLALSSIAGAFAQVPSEGGMVPNTPPGVQANLTATIAPTVSNDATQGYQVGSLWQNASTGQIWIARSVAAGAAVWTNLELSDHPGYIVGNWYVPFGQSIFSAGTAVVANSARFTPGYIKERTTINALGVRVNTGGAGNCQAAIYANSAATMRPTGSQLVATASLVSTSPGNINAAVSLQLEAGLYWFGTNCDNAIAVLESVAGGNAAASIGSATANLSLQAATSFNGTATPLTFGTWGDVTSAAWTDTPGTLPALQFKIGSVP